MKKGLYWLPWLAFLISALAIIAGGLIELKHGDDFGLYLIYAGFLSLCVSGFIMTVACGVPEQ